MRLTKYFGDKVFMKSVLTVAIPMMIQQLISGSVHLVDNLMVGTLGDGALAGVGAANRFYMIAQFAMFGLSAAGSIFIAQYFGAKNEGKMKESFRFLILSLLAVGLIFFIFGFIAPTQILTFFTKDPITIELGASYLKVATFTFFPVALILAISGSMRAIGEVKLPLFISSISVIINTILNYCLIFGAFGFPTMGIVGAGLATLIARLIELALFMYFLKDGDYLFKTKITNLFHVSENVAKRIFVKALPLLANEVAWSAGMATLYMLYSTGGSEVMAGYTVASTVADIFFVLFGGMAAASTVMIAHPLGANELDKARENGYQLIGFSVLLAIFFAILMFMSSFAVPYLYKDISQGAMNFAVIMLRIQSLMLIFYMISTQNYFILRAGGDTVSTFLFDSGFMWLINIPLVAILAYYTDLPMYIVYFWGQMIEFLKIAMGFYFVRKEKWVHNLAHEE